MKASVDLRGPDLATFDIQRELLHRDHPIDGIAAVFLEHFVPHKFPELQLSSERAAWIAQDFKVVCKKKGVMVGKITLWKLQTSLHRDRKDHICVLYCSGDFEGGELLIPDLKKRFKYVPGDMVILDSAALWHSVAPWQPLATECKDGITPGRVARVLTTHIGIIEILLREDWELYVCQKWTPAADR